MRILSVTAARSSEATVRSVMLTIALTSLAGCASTISDAATGYPASPTAPVVATDSTAIHPRVASAEPGRDVQDRTLAPATLEPKFVPHELAAPAPREPVGRRDFVECWQCRR